MIVSRASFQCLLLTAVFLLAAGKDTRADIENPPTPRVPVARAGRAEAVKGFPVEIRLEGLTSTTRPLQFIIRRSPVHGRLLGEPKVISKDTAMVRYLAEAGTRASQDAFSFAVKVEGSGSSLEAPVNIRLIDPMPVLEVPGSVELGRMIANDAVEAILPVRNKGNAPFQATVPLPDGWTWENPVGGKFDLEPGSAMEAKLLVRVSGAGEVNELVTLRPGNPVRFVGRTLPAFLGYPSLLRLQWEREAMRRAYLFRVRNNRSIPLTVTLNSPPGVEVPERLTLAPGEIQEVTVTCGGDVSKVLTGKLRMEATGWSQEIDIEAPAAPAAVEVSGADQGGAVDFGVIDQSDPDKAVRRLRLRNAGGTPALVRWETPRYFMVEGMEPETVLPPGAEQEILIRPRPDEPGLLKEDLVLGMTGGDLTLKLKADIDLEVARAGMTGGQVLEVAAPSVAPDGPPTVRRRTEEARKFQAKLFSRGLFEAVPNTDRTLPTVDGVRPTVIDPDRLVFEWDPPAPGEWTYRVFVRMLMNHGLNQPPIPEYGTMDNVKVATLPGGGGRAEVTQLRPGVQWICCIVGIRSDGVATGPGKDMTFFTPPPRNSRWGWRILGVVGVVALGLYIRQKWREDVKWKD